MRNTESTARPNTTPVVLDCRSCTWQIVSDSAVLAGLEQATHRITAHATLPERRQVQHLISAYRQVIGDLPGTLLILAVQQVLDTPTVVEATPAAA
ncbi:MAG TPA: hypothetical protein K8V84_14530 [Nocardiopsis listeri]|uniref:hypothetical protein n=1 Tax=Nocardiopsis listeri TaxID=53440 RepID=UPI001DECF806|nr:hypothetical protein [Nocardiopsis listeri]HJE59703.1 hypothetical protein [Nocardiopsis listeri]